MLERIGQRFEHYVRQYMPDPFLLVLIFSLLTFALALLFTPSSFDATLQYWFHGTGKDDGFWSMLAFGMQMVLIVVTGEAVAASPSVHALIKRLASIPRTPFGAVAYVSFVSMFLGWLHWGFGLITAALLAREVGAQAKARGMIVHYPLLGAAGYTSLLIWHGGLSGSAPLNANMANNPLMAGVGQIPLSQTVFDPMNLIACGALLVTVPFLLAALTPKSGQVEIPSATVAEMTPVDSVPNRETLAGRIDSSPITSWLIAGLGIAFLVQHFRARGADLNHNIVNFTILMLGLLLHRSPLAYMKAITQSLRGTAGIVVQFPFYGGIMGIMKGSGLAELIASLFVQFSNAHTLPFFTYLSSVFSKLFIPSGAGEWAVEGPIMLKAAKELGTSYGKTILAICYGNMVGNMFQPFWALPLLGIMGLTAREIMGYCLVIFCFAFPVLGLILLSYG